MFNVCKMNGRSIGKYASFTGYLYIYIYMGVNTGAGNSIHVIPAFYFCNSSTVCSKMSNRPSTHKKDKQCDFIIPFKGEATYKTLVQDLSTPSSLSLLGAKRWPCHETSHLGLQLLCSKPYTLCIVVSP